MLVLMCAIGAERLAFPVERVVEVVPRIELQLPADQSTHLAGRFVYRGRPTPVLNFNQSWSNLPQRLSHRLVLLDVAIGDRQEVVGVPVEQATTQQLSDVEVAQARSDSSLRTRWGSILLDERGMFQLVDLELFLPNTVLADLFPALFSH